MYDLSSPKFQELYERRFYPATRSKGDRIFREGKVQRCEVTDHGASCDVVALVQGSAFKPYEVTLKCWMSAGHMVLAAKCTCPIGMDCKHVYAVLLAAGQNQLKTVPFPFAAGNPPPRSQPAPARLSPDWNQWLNRMIHREAEGSALDRELNPFRRLLYVLKPSSRTRETVG